MSAIDNIHIHLSGGASNTDPNLALGGILSSQRVLSQAVTGLSTITGVVINYAHSNSLGTASLAYINSPKTLAWGGGTPVSLSADGTYYLKNSTGDGTLEITVTFASLPTTDQTDTLTVSVYANQVFDDISGVEGYNGDTEYRCLYLRNSHGTATYQLNVWIAAQPSGADTLAIGFDPAGVGNGSTSGVATTIVDEGTAPSGVTFSAPATENTALVTTLPPGQARALWQRRVITAGQRAEVAQDLSQIGLSVLEA